MANEIEKNPSGRPSKYQENFCEDIIAYCSKEARSFASWCAEKRIARSTFNKWKDEIPAFSEACQIAAAQGQKYLEQAALACSLGTEQGVKMNAGMIQFMLKSRYEDYRPQQYIETKANVKTEVDAKVDAKVATMNPEELAEEMIRRAERIKLRQEREVAGGQTET